jgi:hypothetical protein
MTLTDKQHDLGLTATQERIVQLRINGFSDFIHHPDSKELEDKNTTFWCLPSPEDGNRSSFCNVLFLSSNSLESEQWTKSKTPLILCYISWSEPYTI